MAQRRLIRSAAVHALAMAGLFAAALSPAAAQSSSTTFSLVRSGTAVTAGCLSTASGQVSVTSLGAVELMKVAVTGLPSNTDFDLFVIQLPNAPFGLSWYQGDIETDANGNGTGTFVGRFSLETFIVAPGGGQAPVVHPTDAAANPVTNPVHTYHVGLWFNSPADAATAGCPSTVTPFNGDHTAGIQALSTRTFPDTQGPLRQIVPGASASGLSISPPSGVFATNQHFDLELIASTAGRPVLNQQSTFDGVDVSAALGNCLTPGNLFPSGVTLTCANVPVGLIGAGTHVLSVTLGLGGGVTVSDTVIWFVEAAVGN